MIATSRNSKSKDLGDKLEVTDWHRVVLFDRLAKIAKQYLKKGCLVYIEGRLKIRKWPDKEGCDAYAETIGSQSDTAGARVGGPFQDTEIFQYRPCERSNRPQIAF